MNWLTSLSSSTVIIVPTRSLASLLHDELKAKKLRDNTSVWIKHTIYTWSDYLHALWQHNCAFTMIDACTLLSSQQSLLLWQQVVEDTRKQDESLALLNVAQTAKSAQKSWQLTHDWCLDTQKDWTQYSQEAEQLLTWFCSYKQKIKSLGAIDVPMLQSYFLQRETAINALGDMVVWYAFDLTTTVQSKLHQKLAKQGVNIQLQSPVNVEQKQDYLCFDNNDQEIRHVLAQVKKQLQEKPKSKINVIIPNLPEKLEDVHLLCHESFYPELSVLQSRKKNDIYRFSLGQPFARWSAIEVALYLIQFAHKPIEPTLWNFIVHNAYINITQSKQDAQSFSACASWVMRHCAKPMSVNTLFSLCREHKEKWKISDELMSALTLILQHKVSLQKALDNARSESGYASLPHTYWREWMEKWLQLWGWDIMRATHDSVHYQLHNRWKSLLNDFVSCQIVQKSIGIKKASTLLRQMSQDAVFLPEAKDTPVIFSQLYETIGRQADMCFLTGMNEHFPSAAKADKMLPWQVLKNSEYPNINGEAHYQQINNVVCSATQSASKIIVSYSRFDGVQNDIAYQPSPLFRMRYFAHQEVVEKKHETAPLEIYEDDKGLPCEASKIRGGTSIFQLQAQCPFKAYAVHRLQYQKESETEFGIDHLDRGTLLHQVLYQVWSEIKSLRQLQAISDDVLHVFCEKQVSFAIKYMQERVYQEKKALLDLEYQRTVDLVLSWLQYEKTRTEDFKVEALEKEYRAQYAGVGFTFIVDRIDRLNNGQCLIIDYKTGQVAVSDWDAQRMKKPQLPLYAVILAEKNTPLCGIAYASVNLKNNRFLHVSSVPLSPNDTATKVEKNTDQWEKASVEWPKTLRGLAEGFLQADARVQPIDASVCSYCDLQSLCRITQQNTENDAGNSDVI